MSTIGPVSGHAPVERTALADLLAAIGPDRPTLCAGWTTRDLAAHLVVRAYRPDAGAGIVVRQLAGHTRKVQNRAATRDWDTLVAQVRRLPFWWAPVDESLNLTEYFVHHEDVRRAQPGWEPRELDGDLSAKLWGRVRALTKLALRRTPATVTVSAPGYGSVTAGRGGDAAVTLKGAPQELLLFLMGRQDHALVDLAGPQQITERMRHAHYGI
jgi:uncharacterized protein (TIGR03085 family)